MANTISITVPQEKFTTALGLISSIIKSEVRKCFNEEFDLHDKHHTKMPFVIARNQQTPKVTYDTIIDDLRLAEGQYSVITTGAIVFGFPESRSNSDNAIKIPCGNVAIGVVRQSVSFYHDGKNASFFANASAENERLIKRIANTLEEKYDFKPIKVITKEDI